MNRDNQQVKSLFDIGWISAMIDGEGWLIFNKQKLPSQNYRYVPVIGINNTSLKLVDKMCEILDEWQIGYWRGKRNFKNPRWKRQYIIRISGFKRCMKLLPLLEEYLVDKNEQAKLLREFIEYRLSLPNIHFNKCGEKEEAYRQRLQQLNK